jgi:hypothetical protein
LFKRAFNQVRRMMVGEPEVKMEGWSIKMFGPRRIMKVRGLDLGVAEEVIFECSQISTKSKSLSLSYGFKSRNMSLPRALEGREREDEEHEGQKLNIFREQLLGHGACCRTVQYLCVSLKLRDVCRKQETSPEQHLFRVGPWVMPDPL